MNNVTKHRCTWDCEISRCIGFDCNSSLFNKKIEFIYSNLELFQHLFLMYKQEFDSELEIEITKLGTLSFTLKKLTFEQLQFSSEKPILRYENSPICERVEEAIHHLQTFKVSTRV